MEVINYPDAKNVVICGDIHGDFKPLVHKLCKSLGLKDTLLIVAGDCGFGFKTRKEHEALLNRLERKLRKANNWITFVRGNHDDPSYYSESKINTERWRTVPDYSVIRANGHNILCVGGAVSIDRAMRRPQNTTQRPTFWADEAPVFRPDEIESIPEDIRIDTVVSHTAPSSCEISSQAGILTWALFDSTLLQDCAQERSTMNMVKAFLEKQGHHPQDWFYGHFHQSWTGTIDDTRFHMLDIMEFKELRKHTENNE